METEPGASMQVDHVEPAEFAVGGDETTMGVDAEFHPGIGRSSRSPHLELLDARMNQLPQSRLTSDSLQTFSGSFQLEFTEACDVERRPISTADASSAPSFTQGPIFATAPRHGVRRRKERTCYTCGQKYPSCEGARVRSLCPLYKTMQAVDSL